MFETQQCLTKILFRLEIKVDSVEFDNKNELSEVNNENSDESNNRIKKNKQSKLDENMDNIEMRKSCEKVEQSGSKIEQHEGGEISGLKIRRNVADFADAVVSAVDVNTDTAVDTVKNENIDDYLSQRVMTMSLTSPTCGLYAVAGSSSPDESEPLKRRNLL